MIDQAEAIGEREPDCDLGDPDRTVCRALWLSAVLDPVEIWLGGMSAEDRARASDVVDHALVTAAGSLSPESLDAEALDAESLDAGSLDAGSSGVESLENGPPSTGERLIVFAGLTRRVAESVERGDEAIAVALVERNDSDVVAALRALERRCVSSSD